MAVIEAYSTCDICEKKFVGEIKDKEKETETKNFLWVQDGTGVQEYDVCDSCLKKMKLKKGRTVVLTTRQLV